MKTWIAVILILLAFLISGSAVIAEEPVEDPYEIPIQQVFAEPDEESRLLYEIPIEVTLLDVSEDANWFKVRISFVFGPFHYTYVGWTPLPIGKIIIEREAICSEIASLP